MSAIDLHIHSSVSSDGEFSPGEIVNMSKKRGLQVISITDHNSIRGVKPGLEAAASVGITLIPGIEIDCLFDDLNLHILGYNIDIENPAFLKIEKAAIVQEKEYFPRLITRLQELGFNIQKNDVLKHSSTLIPCEEDVGAYLIDSAENLGDIRLLPYREGGTRSDNPLFNFYLDFCTRGKSAYIERQYPDLRSIVQIIIEAGGIPILAHPGESLPDPDKELHPIVKEGILGFEAFSSYHTPEMSQYFMDQAEEFGILVTCGSDFHGKIKPAISLGSVECKGLESQILKGLMI
ncbi:MAG: PHP domain-containing protein [Chloroflexota bacterium]|nr:PHP domain-containing protein [Chloroflexota bacterium]